MDHRIESTIRRFGGTKSCRVDVEFRSIDVIDVISRFPFSLMKLTGARAVPCPSLQTVWPRARCRGRWCWTVDARRGCCGVELALQRERLLVSHVCEFGLFQLFNSTYGMEVADFREGKRARRGRSAGETSLDSLDATRQCHQAQLLRSVAMCEATLFIVISDEARA